LVNIFTVGIIAIVYVRIILEVIASQRSLEEMGSSPGSGISTSMLVNVSLLVGSNTLVWLLIMVLSVLAVSSVEIPSEMSR